MSTRDEITRATTRRAAAAAESAAAREDQAAVIRQAIAEGIGVAEIVQLTGLTRMRIYQIRDGRR